MMSEGKLRPTWQGLRNTPACVSFPRNLGDLEDKDHCKLRRGELEARRRSLASC